MTTPAAELQDASPRVAICLRSGEVRDELPSGPTLDPSQSHAEQLAALAADTSMASASILFLKQTDGRAYTLAARIREAALPLRLHAVGAIHQDLLYFLRRSGFDVAHLPQREGLLIGGLIRHQAAALLTPFGAHYQSAADGSPGLIGSIASAQIHRLVSREEAA